MKEMCGLAWRHRMKMRMKSPKLPILKVPPSNLHAIPLLLGILALIGGCGREVERVSGKEESGRVRHATPRDAKQSDAAPDTNGPDRPRTSLPPKPRTVGQVVDALLPAVTFRFARLFRAAHLSWPPRSLTLIGLKKERSLEVWCEEGDRRFRIATYRITAASGAMGPKRRQGDRQVPEGTYGLPHLNPNSTYHLSILVDYPNSRDVANAIVPRARMGGDIYIHGDRRSIGCIAIGDMSIEELFVMCAITPADARRIIIAPLDLRIDRAPHSGSPWIRQLYKDIAREMRPYRDHRR